MVELFLRLLTSYNQRAEPFTWVKTADHLLGKIKRNEIISTRR